MLSENGLPSPLLALQRTTHVTLHALGAALADTGLTGAEMNVLANLAGRGALSVRQLGEQAGTKPSTLTSVLDRLERRGYLSRELDASDRRSFRLLLTESGRDAAAQVSAAISTLEDRALGALTAEQLAGFHAVVTALREAS